MGDIAIEEDWVKDLPEGTPVEWARDQIDRYGIDAPWVRFKVFGERELPSPKRLLA